jgi:hypothetical protein
MAFAINRRDPALNYIVVAGVPSPGRASVTGVRIPYHWDITQGYGLSGAITIFRGRGVSKFTVTITMFEDEHFVQWPIFKAVLQPPTKLKPLAFDMIHPVLSSAGIKAVQIEELGEPERQSNGMWIATLKFLEYRPPLPALVNPKGSVPGVKANPIPPKTAAELDIDAQLARLATNRLHP